jgi:glycosyltransferase involved in cell wall biosynthesis
MWNGRLRTKSVIKQSQDNKPHITIITVVYNGEKTLEKTILSIINQTYKNYEYIVIDGSSNDGTFEIMKKYEDKIDHWISEPDDGIYDAMNKGVSLATGEWINFMNSGDTFYSNDVLSQFSSFLNQDADLYFGDIYADKKYYYGNQSTISNMFFLMGGMICHQTMFANKRLFAQKIFDTDFKIVADKDWLIYLFKNGLVYKYIPMNICNYDQTGVSSNVSNSRIEFFSLIKRHYGFGGFLFVKFKYFCGKIVKRIFPYKLFTAIG